MKKKYYLKGTWEEEWTEVDEEMFVEAERSAGFRPKPGCGPVATGGFSSGVLEGKVEYIQEEEAESGDIEIEYQTLEGSIIELWKSRGLCVETIKVEPVTDNKVKWSITAETEKEGKSWTRK